MRDAISNPDRYQRIAPFYDLLDLRFEWEALPRVAAITLSWAFGPATGRRRRNRPELPVLSGGCQRCCRHRPQSAHVGVRRAAARSVAYPDRAEADGRNNAGFRQQHIRCRRLHVSVLRSVRSPAGARAARARQVVKPGGPIRLLEYVRPQGTLRRMVSKIWNPGSLSPMELASTARPSRIFQRPDWRSPKAATLWMISSN